MPICKICGKPCPPDRRAYCSAECACIGRRTKQRDWQRAYYARQQNSPEAHKRIRRKSEPRVCKICGEPLVGYQRAYCTICIEKYPHWYDRQMLAQSPEGREVLAQKRSKANHDQYIKRQANMTPSQQDAYHERMRNNARAYYMRKTSGESEDAEAFRQKLRDRANARYARKRETKNEQNDC